jgi:hypothetical protein
MQIYSMNSKATLDLLPIFTETLYVLEHAAHEAMIPILGGFEKKVMVVIGKEDHTPAVLTFIEKMLGACKLLTSDYYVMVNELDNLSLTMIRKYEPDTIILFGVAFANEFFSIQKKTYQPFRFHEQKWLMAEAVSLIVTDAQRKSLLWTNGLKPLFNID